MALHDVVPAPSIAEQVKQCPLLLLHDSLLARILEHVDIQGRGAWAAACRRLSAVARAHPVTSLDLSSVTAGSVAWRFIEATKGSLLTIRSARHQQRTACAATSAARFSTGVRCTTVVPYTTGPAALRLAAALPALRALSLHEATACLGGMTDTFAAALAAHCPALEVLEVEFTRYSMPSELFTDAGMLALAAGCPRLSRLSLTNCGAITDRSLYAVAVHCRRLAQLELGGYHELITDYGAVVLFQACSRLSRVALSGKLRRVTDEAAEALAAGSGGCLRAVKLTSSMGDRALAALAARCGALREVDCCKCEPGAVTVDGAAGLLAAAGAALAAAPPPCAAAAASAAEAEDGAAGEAAGGPVVRLLLPRGLRAADVVARGRERAGAAGRGLRWRAVAPAAARDKAAPAAAGGSAAVGHGGGIGGGSSGVGPGIAVRHGGLPRSPTAATHWHGGGMHGWCSAAAEAVEVALL